MTAPSRRTGIGWASVALVILLASTWLVVSASLHGASTAIVSGGRTGFTVLGLLVLTRITHARGVRSDRVEARPYRWWQVLLLGLTGVTAYTVLSTAAIRFAGAALPTLIMSLTPAVILVVESVLSRSRPRAVTIFGTAVAVAGAMLYVIPQLGGALGRDVAIGTLLALGAMFCMAFYGLYFARVNRGYAGPMALRILPIFAAGMIPLGVWAAAGVSGGDPVTWSTIGLLALLGIAIYVPVYLLQHRIILAKGPSYAALLGLAVPPLVGYAAAVLHVAGVPGIAQVCGTALTLLGMTMVISSTRERAQVLLERKSEQLTVAEQ